MVLPGKGAVKCLFWKTGTGTPLPVPVFCRASGCASDAGTAGVWQAPAFGVGHQDPSAISNVLTRGLIARAS
jgi:hypothetical protein